MYKIYSLLAISIFAFSSFSQNLIELNTEINDVKLYLTSGEISRNTELKLNKGRNKLVFKGISAYADGSSIQFSGDKDFTIVSTNTEMDFFTTEFLNKEVNTLKDSLTYYEKKNDKIKNEKNGIHTEIDVLKKNTNFTYGKERISIEELGRAADFFKERITKAMNQISQLDYKYNHNKDQINHIRRKLTELNFKENERSNQIIILVDVPMATTLNCNLRYLVSDCGWAATYDLIATNVIDPIQLVYKAQVYNNTGNDWKNVNMVLTTNDPNMDASLPQLEVWNVNGSLVNNQLRPGYISPRQKAKFSNSGLAKQNVAQMNQRAYDTYVLDKANASSQGVVSNGTYLYNGRSQETQISGISNKKNVEFTNINISQIAVDFEIEHPFSVPADARPYTLEIKSHQLDANFSHVLVPKMAKESFLLANIVGWQNLDLIPGSTQVYFGGNFVGSSFLSTENVTDTLKLSFGRDAKVLALRKLIKQNSQNIMLSNNKKNTYTFEVTIKNNRSESVTLNVFDQIPTSSSSEITVEALEISKAKHNLNNGELEWKLNLAPGESKKLIISFSVKHPKDKDFKVKKYRTTVSPRFL